MKSSIVKQLIFLISLTPLLWFSNVQARAPLLLAGNYDTNSILSYDLETGAFMGIFASGGGLDGPTGMAFGPDNNLYVLSNNTDSVLRYSGVTGDFIDTFATLPSNYSLPKSNTWGDLAFGPDGNLYVSSQYIPILRFDGKTGAFIDTFGSGSFDFITFGSDGDLYASMPGLSVLDGTTGEILFENTTWFINDNTFGPAFGPDAKLYLSGDDADDVFSFDLKTGTEELFLRLGDYGFDPEAVYIAGNPTSMVFGPNDDLYLARHGGPTGSFILRFDGVTAEYIDTFSSGPSLYGASDGGLNSVTRIAFTPMIRRVRIDIRPATGLNLINVAKNEMIPVAIISTHKFNAPRFVDVKSLTFGRTGDEQSLSSCHAADVNWDGLKDLVCFFSPQSARFQSGDTEGIMRGMKRNGGLIAGKDSVRIVPRR